MRSTGAGRHARPALLVRISWRGAVSLICRPPSIEISNNSTTNHARGNHTS